MGRHVDEREANRVPLTLGEPRDLEGNDAAEAVTRETIRARRLALLEKPPVVPGQLLEGREPRPLGTGTTLQPNDCGVAGEASGQRRVGQAVALLEKEDHEVHRSASLAQHDGLGDRGLGAPLEPRRQGARGRRLGEKRGSHSQARFPFEPLHDPGGTERVSAEVEEVVLAVYRRHADDFFEEGRDPRRDVVSRRSRIGPARIERREPSAIHLAVLVQGKPLHPHESRGDACLRHQRRERTPQRAGLHRFGALAGHKVRHQTNLSVGVGNGGSHDVADQPARQQSVFHRGGIDALAAHLEARVSPADVFDLPPASLRPRSPPR